MTIPDDWIIRAQKAAQFIPPGARVLDCGAGEGWIREVLKKPFEYTAVDRDPTGPTNIVCDFNKGEFPTPANFTHGLCLGLIEYLKNLPAFLAGVRHCADDWVISHRGNRGRTHGEVITAFEVEGFRLKRCIDIRVEINPEILFVFSRTR